MSDIPFHWKQVPAPPGLWKMLVRRGAKWVKVFEFHDVHVIITPEPYLSGARFGLHLSISCADRDPTWEEQKRARYDLLPDDLVFAQFLPARTDFDTLADSHVFHWFEVDPEPVAFVKEGWL